MKKILLVVLLQISLYGSQEPEPTTRQLAELCATHAALAAGCGALAAHIMQSTTHALMQDIGHVDRQTRAAQIGSTPTMVCALLVGGSYCVVQTGILGGKLAYRGISKLVK